MTDIVKVKTGNRFEELGSYSRLVAVDNLNPRTKLIPADLTEQTLQVLANIETALAAVGATLADTVAARVFVQFPEDVEVIMAAYAKRMRGINPTLTMTSPPLGSAEYKVEIEITAYRGASQANVKEINLAL
jgi:enamine deaminase RidA (YjgF/YER057c/UK114 family)